MLNNADTLLASPEKAMRRKRRTQAEMLHDARTKLAEAKMVPIRVKNQDHNNI